MKIDHKHPLSEKLSQGSDGFVKDLIELEKLRAELKKSRTKSAGEKNVVVIFIIILFIVASLLAFILISI